MISHVWKIHNPNRNLKIVDCEIFIKYLKKGSQIYNSRFHLNNIKICMKSQRVFQW